jgi:hypothetical protein
MELDGADCKAKDREEKEKEKSGRVGTTLGDVTYAMSMESIRAGRA